MKLSDIDFQDQTHQISYKSVMRMTVLANIQSKVQCLVGLSENAQLMLWQDLAKGFSGLPRYVRETMNIYMIDPA